MCAFCHVNNNKIIPAPSIELPDYQIRWPGQCLQGRVKIFKFIKVQIENLVTVILKAIPEKAAFIRYVHRFLSA